MDIVSHIKSHLVAALANRTQQKLLLMKSYKTNGRKQFYCPVFRQELFLICSTLKKCVKFRTERREKRLKLNLEQS